jgi:uncharacterized protein YjbI with pentapeptide repeats
LNNLTNDINSIHDQDFIDIKYAEQKISNKEFYNCHFKSCDFNGTIFMNCEFTYCTFIECNLNNVAVNNSKFVDIEFNNCKVIGVNWTMAHWRDFMLSAPLTFKKCLINSSSFYGLALEKVIIEECRAHDVDFREANVKNGSFSHTDLRDSLFNKTNLTGVNFSEAENYDINIKNNIITNATFCRYEAVRLLSGLDINLID